MKTIKIFSASLFFGLFAFFTTSLHAQPLERWANNHPEASKALEQWVRTHSRAAHYIFEWDGHHPERSQALVTWALQHPKENSDVFYAQHKNWPELEAIMNKQKEGVETFLFWCRNHAPAARALMSHPAALQWAGNHLYAQYLAPETPPK